MPCGCEKRRKALKEWLKRIVPARKSKAKKRERAQVRALAKDVANLPFKVVTRDNTET